MNKRAVIMNTAIVFGFALVLLRLADLMIVNHRRLSDKANLQYKGRQDLRVNRGGIFDRSGRELAVNLDSYSVYCDPFLVDSPKETAAALASVTGRKYRRLLKLLDSKKRFVWIKRKLEHGKTAELKALGLKGLGFLPEVKRFYPKGSLASHVVGFVGIDNQPLEGIELVYDKQLRGRAESVQFDRDARGRTLSRGLDFERGGNSLVLTIDEGLQYIVEKELYRAVEQWQAVSASSVMMDPNTGEIFAMANMPTYDLNDPSLSRVSDRRNRTVTDSYEPGSTFKVIAAAAALEEGLVKTTTEFDCSKGFIKIGTRAIWDTSNKGVLTFSEVIKASSNVGTVIVAQMLARDRLYEYVDRFGFGKRTGIDLYGESPGKVPPIRKWSETTLASASIGYGVAVTPLQILGAYSVVANGGILVKPHMVSEIISPEGEVVYRFMPGERRRVISRMTSRTLRDILVSVTQEGGTAMGASVDGNRVAGKTGTARLIDPDTGEYSTERYVSSFVGFAPADNPRLALVVVIFEPKGKYYGGQVAAPVFREIVDRSLSYLSVPRDDNFGKNLLVKYSGEL
jgi:cell division protein FtsI (penicillin-binding protein 3)